MPIGDIAPEIALVLSAVAIVLLATFLPRAQQRLCAFVALAGGLVALALVAIQLRTPVRETFSGLWVIDPASIWARLLILAVTLAVTMMSIGWFRADQREGEYYALLLLSALGAMILAGATDLLQLVMGILLSSVTGYTLAAYHRDWALSVEAGMKYFLIGALANAVLMVGVALLFGLLGDSSYAAMAAALGTTAPSPLLLVGFALTVVGVAFKLGAVPVHSWMPDVAEGAPAPVAAFLTIAPKIGGAIALARLVTLFGGIDAGVRPLVAALAVATMTLGNLAALWQSDVRRLLGWSSVSQSGYALMAVTIVGLVPDATAALLLFLAGYAAANLTAFGAVIHLRGRTAIEDYAGFAGRRPFTAAALALALLSLVGVPPLAGFVGKLLLFKTTIAAGYAWLAAIAVANTVISLFYYLRVLARMYFGERGGNARILGGWSGAALAIGAVGVPGIGIFAGLVLAAF